MPRITEKEAIILALEQMGKTKVPNPRTSRYIVYTRSPKRPGAAGALSQPATFYFIGSKGALRFGQKVTTCRPVSETRRKELISRGRGIIGQAKAEQARNQAFRITQGLSTEEKRQLLEELQKEEK
jgi:hypothetical protein